MKTKLILTIEIEEEFLDTQSLYSKLMASDGVLPINEVFSPGAKVIATRVSNLVSPRTNFANAIGELHGPTTALELECIMSGRSEHKED
ncbi:hypothetical protein [Brumimicrobium mesophilum]|uniref:hypothetical protein n=1 Tax=Brumimicrobium mesophilum TaxID=392717 RepID=UPI000D13EEFF|nr:hypothetical protein [Brumimicrobium mesophilum]